VFGFRLTGLYPAVTQAELGPTKQNLVIFGTGYY